MAEQLAEARNTNLQPEHFVGLWQELRRAQRDIDRATGVKRSILKRCKSGGVDLEAMALLQKLSKMEEDESEMLLRNASRYGRWLQLPLGKQLDMFERPNETISDEIRASVADFDAEDRGYKAGFSGHKIDTNPYIAGSSEFDRWARSWHEGQGAAVHKRLGGEDGTTGAAPGEEGPRRGRGRPAGSKNKPKAAAAEPDGEAEGDGDGEADAEAPAEAAPKAPRAGRSTQTGRRRAGAEAKVH